MRDHSASAAPEQDNEFELVLGNKQLFSVLFLVFVLLGVFFAMGYVLGRSSTPIEPVAARRSDAASETTPATTGRRSTIEGAVSSREAESPKSSESATSAESPSGSESSAASSRTDSSPVNVSVVDPKPGQIFLQVSAVAKPEAELLVEVLSKKGFQAIVAPGPNDKLFRVLVGPARDDADLGKTRTELEQAGFRPIPRRY